MSLCVALSGALYFVPNPQNAVITQKQRLRETHGFMHHTFPAPALDRIESHDADAGADAVRPTLLRKDGDIADAIAIEIANRLAKPTWQVQTVEVLPLLLHAQGLRGYACAADEREKTEDVSHGDSVISRKADAAARGLSRSWRRTQHASIAHAWGD